MKNLFENWRLFTEAEGADPFFLDKVLDRINAEDALKTAIDRGASESQLARLRHEVKQARALEDIAMGRSTPKSIRRPAAVSPPLPAEARIKPPPLPPDATPPLPPEDLVAGLPTDRDPTRAPVQAPVKPKTKPPKVTFRVPGIGVVNHEDGKEAMKVIDRISENHTDLEAMDQGIKKQQLTPMADETEELERLRGENERLKRRGNRRNSESLLKRTKKLGLRILGWLSTGLTIATWAYFADDCAAGFKKANPDASDTEAKTVALGITAYMIATDYIIMPDAHMPPETSPWAMAGAGLMTGGSARSGAWSAARASRKNIPTDATGILLDALGIADEVEEARQERENREERLAIEKAEKEKAAAARDIAKRNQEDYPASYSRDNVTPEEPDHGPVPDENLRENFKRTNKIKKLIINIS